MILILSLPTFAEEVNDPDNIGYVECPKGGIRKVNKHNPYYGGRVRCEDFNRFFELLEEGRVKEAGKLLIEPVRPDLKRKLKPIRFRHTPWDGEKILISPVERV